MKSRSVKTLVATATMGAVILGTGIINAQAASLYRVRLDWSNASSQIGAYSILENAKAMADANPGYEVYDENGNVVYGDEEVNTPVATEKPVVEVEETSKTETQTTTETNIEKVEDTKVETSSNTYTVSSTVAKYVTAENAANGQGSVGSYSAGTYYIYKSYNGMLNISKTEGVPGGWINPEGNGSSKSPEVTTPVVTKPEPTTTTEEKAPETAPETVENGTSYTLKASTAKYLNASDAMSNSNSTGTYAAGSYYIYKSYNGMINITKTPGVPGGWINPSGSTSSNSGTSTPTTPTKPTTPTSSSVGNKVVSAAKSVLGTPYVWGGESLSEGGFDCSGLAYWAYQQAGISIPRTSTSQYNGMTKVSNPEPGDLVIYAYGGDIVHTGIYIGEGKIIHAPDEGDVVRIANAQMYTLSTVGYVRAR